MPIKLVKNTKTVKRKIKLNRTVNNTFKKAMKKAASQDWSRMIIIGQGKKDGSWQYTPMYDATVLGMLEQTKYFILETAPD